MHTSSRLIAVTALFLVALLALHFSRNAQASSVFTPDSFESFGDSLGLWMDKGMATPLVYEIGDRFDAGACDRCL